MFEKEIEFIYNYSLNKIKGLGSFITYEQLKNTNLHPALLQYISAEIDFLIFEDRQKLLKDSLFDYSDEKITEYFILIGDEIKKTKKFSIEYLTKLLLHASSFNVNFLVRPKWSLLQFVFDNENESSKPISEVKPVLNYLYYYPYLKRLLISFFNKKRLLSISQNEFQELLEKIDGINYENNFEKVLDSAFRSMVEFINMGEPNNEKISKQMVELFLDDKNLQKYKVAITETFGVNGNDKFPISDFKNSILNFNVDSFVETNKEDRDRIINEQILKTDNVEETSDEINDSEVEESIDNIEEDNIVESNVNEVVDDYDNLSEEKGKSFIESHLENLDEEIEDTKEDTLEEIDEIEPPEIDETPRIDEEIIEEAAELAVEEEEIEETVDDEITEFSRVEIDDSEPDPFEDVKDPDELVDEEAETKIEIGDSVTFSSDELDEEADEEVDEEEWPTESSSEPTSIELETEDNESEINDFTPTESSVIIEADDTELDNENDIKEEVQDSMNDEVASIKMEEEEEISESLFSEKDFEEDSGNDEENSNTEEEIDEPTSKIDISSLLENKKITKIIEVIFDYDMEEFANTIDEISISNSLTEALLKIDSLAEKNYIGKDTKEIKLFKNIISEYFE